jgi:hypothetical protein
MNEINSHTVMESFIIVHAHLPNTHHVKV